VRTPTGIAPGRSSSLNLAVRACTPRGRALQQHLLDARSFTRWMKALLPALAERALASSTRVVGSSVPCRPVARRPCWQAGQARHEADVAIPRAPGRGARMPFQLPPACGSAAGCNVGRDVPSRAASPQQRSERAHSATEQGLATAAGSGSSSACGGGRGRVLHARRLLQPHPLSMRYSCTSSRRQPGKI